MSSHNVLVLGTGSIGAFFASRLATLPNLSVSTICRSNYKAVLENGIRLTSPIYKESTFRPTHVFSSPEDAKRVRHERKLSWDYFFVATKVLRDEGSGDPSELLEGLVGEDDEAQIVVCQNGLGVEDPYWRRFPGRTILSVVTR